MSSDLDIALARLARALETRQKRRERSRATACDRGASSPLGTAGDLQTGRNRNASDSESDPQPDGWVDRFLDE